MKRWRLRPKLNSIHAKLLATYLLLTTFGTSLMAGYILWSFYDYFITTRQADLETWTAALSESVADALEAQELERVQVLVQRYGASEQVTLRVFTPAGHLLATSSPELDRQITDWSQIPGIQAALSNQSAQGIAKGVLSKDDRLYVSRPVIRNQRLLGALRMSITLEQFQRQFSRIVGTVLGTLLLTMMLCAILSNRFARNLSQPIEAMQTFALRVGRGNFEDKLSIRHSNELDQLADELNQMSQRLASLDQERRVFLANVSHELRTPISNVLVTVDALCSGADREPELRDRFFQTLQAESRRLSRLVHDLLDLGRLEAGVTALEPQSFSILHLIERAVGAMQPRMQEAGVTVQQAVKDGQIYGDPERLLQAILNILDNALKHSSPNSTVFIASDRIGKQIRVQIQDQGAGIQSPDLPRIFEQFYTTDASRKGSSAGLGLAIARKIVEAHGGSITADSTFGQGATFTIWLPLQDK